MNSEKLDLLLPALHLAQGAFHHAIKDSTNPHFKSKYADLATVLDTCKPALQANGLVVTHQRESADGDEFITTTLWHVSGQYISSRSRLRPLKEDPQGFGSAITYARRYDLTALIGLASDDDDDGNAASQPPVKKSNEANPPPVAIPAFDSDIVRGSFIVNVCKSFNDVPDDASNALEKLIELKQLNSAKLKAMVNGNDKDKKALKEIGAAFESKKKTIEDTQKTLAQMGVL